jgi:hypothetical protein
MNRELYPDLFVNDIHTIGTEYSDRIGGRIALKKTYGLDSNNLGSLSSSMEEVYKKIAREGREAGASERAIKKDIDNTKAVFETILGSRKYNHNPDAAVQKTARLLKKGASSLYNAGFIKYAIVEPTVAVMRYGLKPVINNYIPAYKQVLEHITKAKSDDPMVKMMRQAGLATQTLRGMKYDRYDNMEVIPTTGKFEMFLDKTAHFARKYSGFNYMNDVAKGLTDYLSDSIPEKSFVFASIPGFSGNGGVNGGTARIALVDPEDRKRSQSDIVKAVTKKLPQFNNARIFPVEEQTISVGFGSRGALPVQLILQNLEFEKIKAIIPKFLEEARKDKTFQNVDVNLKFSKPELQLTIDRIKAKDLGLSISDVADVVSSAFSGRRLAYFTMKGKQYDVISQVSLNDRQTPSDILSLYVRNNRGEMIPLSAVVDLKESSNPPTLYHYNRFRSATISASLAEGKTIGDGVKAMDEISKRLLDESFHTSYGGPSRDFKESSSNTTFAFLLALLLIYLVLAGQFESFKDPFIIMITVPLAIAGALISLWMFDQTLNIFSQIGMIMLIGLVTKNGILIVEFANKKRIEGLAKKEAVLEAASQRLRPILMTSLATALGALPIALSLGAAATSRMPLGIVIVGGIFFSLFLTLFVVPAVYIFVSGKHIKAVEENA